MKDRIIGISILLMLTISLLATPLYITNVAEGALPKPELKVEPSFYEATQVGETFNINITISNLDAGLKAVSIQFRLLFGKGLLEVVNIAEGSFLKDPRWNLYGTYFIWYPETNGLYGPHVVVGALLLPNSASGKYDQTQFPQGSGTLATITFKVLPYHDSSACLLDLRETMVLNDNLAEISHLATDGNYQSPRILFKVEPSTYQALAVGEIVNINVTIQNLDAFWNMVSAQFRLRYDNTQLEFVEAKEGSFLKDPRWNLYGTYFIWYPETNGLYGPHVVVGALLLPNDTSGAYDQTKFPEGSGTLATITFKALSGFPSTTTLRLVETIVLNKDLKEIKHFPVDGKYKSPSPTLKVEPSYYRATSVGETFDVSVTISGLLSNWSMVSAQFRLCYDSALLQVVDVKEGAFLKDPRWNLFGTFFMYYPETNGIYGPHIIIGAQLLPNASNGQWTKFPEGSGTLATITFKALNVPVEPQSGKQCLLNLKDTMVLNKDLKEMNHLLVDATYEAWRTIPRATIGVAPSIYKAKAQNEVFDINITISNLDVEWRAVAIEFRLSYNATLLEVVGVTEGPFMKQFPNTAAPPSTYFISFIEGPGVLVGILLLPNASGQWTNFPQGSGTLATITFKAIYQERGVGLPLSCNLTLLGTMLINPELVELPHNVGPSYCTYSIPKIYPIDLNGDGKVDMKDIGIAALAFGTKPGDKRWNPICDITGPEGVPDGKVDMRDVALVARYFGYGV